MKTYGVPYVRNVRRRENNVSSTAVRENQQIKKDLNDDDLQDLRLKVKRLLYLLSSLTKEFSYLTSCYNDINLSHRFDKALNEINKSLR